jgi:hypothetical protein
LHGVLSDFCKIKRYKSPRKGNWLICIKTTVVHGVMDNRFIKSLAMKSGCIIQRINAGNKNGVVIESGNVNHVIDGKNAAIHAINGIVGINAMKIKKITNAKSV